MPILTTTRYRTKNYVWVKPKIFPYFSRIINQNTNPSPSKFGERRVSRAEQIFFLRVFSMLMCFCNFSDGEEQRMIIGQDRVWRFPIDMHETNAFTQAGSEQSGN